MIFLGTTSFYYRSSHFSLEPQADRPIHSSIHTVRIPNKVMAPKQRWMLRDKLEERVYHFKAKKTELQAKRKETYEDLFGVANDHEVKAVLKKLDAIDKRISAAKRSIERWQERLDQFVNGETHES